MKILWVTNLIIGALYSKLYNKPSCGVWMDALLDDFLNSGEHSLVIVTTGDTEKTVSLKEKNVTYYLLPGGTPKKYNCRSKANLKAWSTLIENEAPDIIQVWGTEYAHGLAALKAAPGIPSVIFIQGIMETVARYYYSGINPADIRRSTSLRDVIMRDSILQQRKKYEKAALREKETVQFSPSIISENQWCNSHIRAIVPDVVDYYCELSISKVFSKYRWSANSMIPYSIICNAAGYPIKGLHIILRAVALLKAKYPKVKLYVPGNQQIPVKSLKAALTQRGYTRYLYSLISQYDLADNIVWLGSQSQEQLAEQLSSKNVFVLGSAIENHSSSLKEALFVGIPSVASAVGGVPEYVKHGENAFLYRFEEYEMLAHYVSIIFDNQDAAVKLSRNAVRMASIPQEKSTYEKVNEIYMSIIEKHKSGISE